MRCDRCGLPYDPLSYSPALSICAKERHKMEDVSCSASEPVECYSVSWNEIHLCLACEADVCEFIYGFKKAKEKR